VNVLKCILVQKVGFLKYKSGILHSNKMKIAYRRSNGQEFTRFRRVRKTAESDY
jgi:hypothetical protein